MSKDELTRLILAAHTAARAVNSYYKKNKKYPTVKLKQVKDFQLLEPGLEDDGLWGPNTHAAASYYLQNMTSVEVPYFSDKFGKAAITWEPPIKQIVASHSTQPIIQQPIVKTTPFVSIKKDDIKKLVEDAPKFGQELDFLSETRDVEEKISEGITNTIQPKINNIRRVLEKQDTQTQATYEHNKINTDKNFRNEVLAKLERIIAITKSYPKGHPQRLRLERRIMGLII